MEFLTTPDFKLNSLIKIIGLGGAGGNAVKHMIEIGIKDVDFIVCNTDAQALENSPVNTKIHMGASLTKGRGAGNQPEIGYNAAIESLEDIKAAIGVDTKMVFITAGMGGGTGTGASPVVAEACRELDILTVGIVTTPFSLEGPKRVKQASLGLDKLSAVVDCLMVISNDSILTNYGNMTQSRAFAMANDVVATAAKSIAEIITISGNTNVDFADVETVLRNSGVAIMGSGICKGDHRAINAVEQAITSPLLTESNIHGAQNILVNIGSGNQEVTMDEIAVITQHLQKAAGGEANLIWGSYLNSELEDSLHLTVLATGFKKKSEFIATKKLEFDTPQSKPEVLFETPVSNLFDNPINDVNESKEKEYLDFKVNKNKPEPQKTEVYKRVELDKVEMPITVNPEPIAKTTVILFDDSTSTPTGDAAETLQKIIKEQEQVVEKAAAVPTAVDANKFGNKEDVAENGFTLSVRELKDDEVLENNPKTIRSSSTKAVGVSPESKTTLSKLKTYNNIGLSNDAVNKMESVPAYLRHEIALNSVPKSDEPQNSSLSVGVNNPTVIQTNNQFLNKKID